MRLRRLFVPRVLVSFLEFVEGLPGRAVLVVFILLAVVFSEILVVAQSLLLSGRVDRLNLIIGFFTPLIDGFLIVCFLLLLLDRSKLFRKIIDQSSDAMLVIGEDDGQLLHFNQSLAEALGYGAGELQGLDYPLVDARGGDFGSLRQEMQEAVGRRPATLESRFRRRDGSSYPVELSVSETSRYGQKYFVLVARDISERKEAEKQIRHLAYFDGLTGLPNRSMLLEQLQSVICHAGRYGRTVALLFLDLDDFKRVNDSLGHQLGDALLQDVALRIRSCLRECDLVSRPAGQKGTDFLARLGGDEFAIVLTEVRHDEDAARVARRIIEVLSKPLFLAGHELYISSSIGIALWPADGKGAADLVTKADLAMYAAKAEGKNAYKYFTGALNTKAFERLTIEGRLRRAIDQEEFSLVYQPVFSFARGEIVGVEALLRWQNPDMGFVSPATFVPIAEDTGLIVPLGDWVLRTACRQLRAWTEAGLTDLHMAVNLSGRQFVKRNLAQGVEAILAETGVAPHRLTLEITESILMQDTGLAQETLGYFRKLGLRLAMDDFGTGYSSLSYLKRFPLNIVKIDRSFVKDLTTNPDDAAIARTIQAMAHSLKLETVAEGVETEEQFRFLHQLGCDHMQGYLLSPPQGADRIIELLRAGAGQEAEALRKCRRLLDMN